MKIFGKRIDWLETTLDVVGAILVLLGVGLAIGGVALHGPGRVTLLVCGVVLAGVGVSLLWSSIGPALRHRRSRDA
jgi:hypothetical protein